MSVFYCRVFSAVDHEFNGKKDGFFQPCAPSSLQKIRNVIREQHPGRRSELFGRDSGHVFGRNSALLDALPTIAAN